LYEGGGVMFKNVHGKLGASWNQMREITMFHPTSESE
jgi:hypothetical protein